MYHSGGYCEPRHNVHISAQGRNKITKHVEREVICHSNFCHPHVIQFKEIFLTPTHLAIAMEYAPGGDMFQFVKKSSGLKVRIASYVAEAVNCMLQQEVSFSCLYRPGHDLYCV